MISKHSCNYASESSTVIGLFLLDAILYLRYKLGPDLHQKGSLCFVSANEQHDSTTLTGYSLGFLLKRFSKSIENNNHSRIIYRNDNIAKLVKT